MEKHSKGFLISFDLAGCFDAPVQSIMIREMFRELGNSKYLHLYKNMIENMKLNVDMKWGKVSDIKYESGAPQGLKESC
jgi:hypothetical protein